MFHSLTSTPVGGVACLTMSSASWRQRTASSILDQLAQSDPSNWAIPLGTANVDPFALLILVAEVVPPLGAGAVDGPEVAVGGTAGGKVVAGPDDIVWDVIYRRGAVSDSAQR